jgi:transmembrane 9 superfamily protein 2/4
MRTMPSVLMGGVLPFGVVFVELFFILSSIYQHRCLHVCVCVCVVCVVCVCMRVVRTFAVCNSSRL